VAVGVQTHTHTRTHTHTPDRCRDDATRAFSEQPDVQCAPGAEEGPHLEVRVCLRHVRFLTRAHTPRRTHTHATARSGCLWWTRCACRHTLTHTHSHTRTRAAGEIMATRTHMGNGRNGCWVPVDTHAHTHLIVAVTRPPRAFSASRSACSWSGWGVAWRSGDGRGMCTFSHTHTHAHRCLVDTMQHARTRACTQHHTHSLTRTGGGRTF
jgi:hypothetical protein